MYGEYDFNSIMHYPLNFYVNNGSAMEVLPNVTVPDGVEIGHMHTLSVGDYTKARLMYKCPSKCVRVCVCAWTRVCVCVCAWTCVNCEM